MGVAEQSSSWVLHNSPLLKPEQSSSVLNNAPATAGIAGVYEKLNALYTGNGVVVGGLD